MPTAERYARYREDQTTIWVSKTAADFLSRERSTPGEGASAVLDRVINEYRKMRRAGGGGGATGGTTAPAKSAAKSAAKGATKGAAKSAGTRGTKAAKSAGTRTAKTAKKTA